MESGTGMNRECFEIFSDCLAGLDASCKASNEKQMLSDFQDAFQSGIGVMREILNYVGFQDTILGIRKNPDGKPLTPADKQYNELQVIAFAADDKNCLLHPEDLRSWEEMADDSHLTENHFDMDEMQRKIADVYRPLLKQFCDLAKKFYENPEKREAKVGKTEVFYAKWKPFMKIRTWKVREYFAKDEKMLRGFRGEKVYHNIAAYQNIVSEYSPDLYPGVDAFWQLKGYVIFTDRRVIIVRFKEERDQKEYYFSYPYGKINYFEVRRALPWTKKRGLHLEFAGGPSLSIHFKSRWFVHFRKIVSTISNKLIK